MNRLRMPSMALVMAISLAAIAQDQPATQPATQPVQPAAPFARVDGKWKFDTAEYSRRCNMNVDDEVRQAEAIASAHTTLHKRIEAGEIGTDEQLQEAILDAEEQVNRRIQAAESAP